jgi:hypothetical protein
VETGYIKPSAAVQRARELAKLELKRAAFDQWAKRLREIIACLTGIYSPIAPRTT